MTKAVDILACIIIFVFGVLLFVNRNYFLIPNPDVFGHFDDGKQYVQLKLPPNIQKPPANPIIIELLAKLLKPNGNSEILSAHLINIFAAITLLLLVYLLIRQYSPYVGIFLVVLLCTNPQFVFQSLDVTSEVLFGTSVVLTLLLYQRGHIVNAYICAGCSFLIRYEGACLLAALFVMDLAKNKVTLKTIRAFTLALVPIFIWLIIIHFRTLSGSIFGNGYIQELLMFRGRIPRLELITRLPFLLTDYFSTTTWGVAYSLGAIILSLIVGSSVVFLMFTNNSLFCILSLFVCLYAASHFLYPFFADRYVYPILWCLYAAPMLTSLHYIKRRRRTTGPFIIAAAIIGCAVLFYIAIGNAQKIRTYYQNTSASSTAFSRFTRYDVLLAANWLNSMKFSNHSIVIVDEPWIMKYFTHNKNVSFLSLPYSEYTQCSSVTCIIKNQKLEALGGQILFIQLSNTLLEDASFPSATYFNIPIFNEFDRGDDVNKFALLAVLSHNDVWARIYQYRQKQ